MSTRALDERFLGDLRDGLLSPILARVLADQTLCLELRGNYINVYYRGGNVLRVTQTGTRYIPHFDEKYWGSGERATLPPALADAADVQRCIAALPLLKQAMDLHRGVNVKEEREVQQWIARENNFGGMSRQTDFYICDIEYASGHGRFDMVAVHWPTSERKRAEYRRLVLVEVKYGDGALADAAGLHAHVRDLNAFLADATTVTALKADMVGVFNQKRALKLLDCGKDLAAFSDERPMLLLVLANHNPGAKKLGELLRTLPPSPHADVYVATSSLVGYGLVDEAVLTVEQALDRMAAVVG